MADDERRIQKEVSRPPRVPDLIVLSVDGTDPVDSVSFIDLMKAAARKQKLVVANLLDFVDTRSPEEIKSPTNGSTAGPFPFSKEDVSRLPMEPVTRKLGGKTVKARVLMPQGLVTGDKNTYSDENLGSDKQGAAAKNSLLTEYLSLAPGVTGAHLDFARPGGMSTDILYLSGHGGMSGNVVGEAPDYTRYFTLNKLATEDLLKLAATDLVAPMWIVIAACFSLRRGHCEIWARYFAKQKAPVRGILGYQLTSPTAANSVAVNVQFARELSNGKSFLDAWGATHRRLQLGGRWTALVFDDTKNDTLVSISNERSSPKGAPAQRKLLFYSDENGKPSSHEVRVTPPRALLEVFNWIGGLAPRWEKFMITNIDHTKTTFDQDAARLNDPGLVNNASWGQCLGVTRLVDFDEGHLNFYGFFQHEVYRVQLFPPFAGAFVHGFEEGDEVELSVVHVRRDYSHRYNFRELFAVHSVNGTRAVGTTKGADRANYSIKEPSAHGFPAHWKGTVRFSVPGAGFAPAKISMIFQPRQNFLWFWLSVSVIRRGVEIFQHDFDSYIIAYIADQHYYRFGDRRTSATDPLPPFDE